MLGKDHVRQGLHDFLEDQRVKEDFLKEATLYLEKGLRELRLKLPTSTKKELLFYLRELSAFSSTLGLTSLKTPKDLVVKHILDSLLVLQFLPEEGPLLDLGTGAGIPGMVIKIVRREQEIWLVDARRRPLSFLHYVAGRLNLERFHIFHARVAKSDPIPRCYFKAVISRAVTSLERLFTISGPLLEKEGVLLAMKGPKVAKEIELLKHNFLSLKIERYDLTLPITRDRRTIIKIWLP